MPKLTTLVQIRGILSLALVFALSGCATYVIRGAKSQSLKPGATVGIMLEGPGDQSQFSGFMAASLINRGYKVKVINPEELIPGKIMDFIKPDEKYSFMEAFTEQIAGGGRFQGKAEVLQKMMTNNDIKEAKLRLEDLMQLTDNFLKKWKMDYILFLYPGGKHTYMVKIIQIQDREMVFTHYINANQAGWKNNVPSVKETSSLTISPHSKHDAAALQIQFCEYIADLIK